MLSAIKTVTPTGRAARQTGLQRGDQPAMETKMVSGRVPATSCSENAQTVARQQPASWAHSTNCSKQKVPGVTHIY